MASETLTQKCEKTGFIMHCSDIYTEKCPMNCNYAKSINATRIELSKITSNPQSQY